MAGSYGTGAGAFTEGLDPRMLTFLSRAFPTNDPQFKTDHMGFLRAVREWNTGVQKFVDTGDGTRNAATTRSKEVIAVYAPRYHREDTSTTISNACATGDIPQPCETTFSADNPIESPVVTFNDDEQRRMWENPDTFEDKKLGTAMMAVLEKLNTQLLEAAVPLVGNYKDGAASKTYTVLEANGGNRVNGATQVRKNMSLARNVGQVALIGHGKWFDFFENNSIGASNDTGQLVQRSAMGMTYFEEPLVEEATVFGNLDHAYVMGKDSLAYHTYNVYKGRYVYQTPSHKKFTMPTPFGIDLDVEAWYDECPVGAPAWEAKWNYKFFLHWGLGGLPDNVWSANDPYFGIKYLFKAEALQVP